LFLRRAAGWILLVWGCALPLLIFNWRIETPGGRAGEVCGVAAWTIAVVACDEQLRRWGASGAMRALRSGAAILIVVQWVAVALLDPLFFPFLYAPALVVVGRLRIIPDSASPFLGNLVLTIACGAQAIAGALALGMIIGKARPLWQASSRSGRNDR
jgi:hypothetical protein